MEIIWNPWTGGRCPVSPLTVVEAEFDDGGGHISQAGNMSWAYAADEERRIVRYRLVMDPPNGGLQASSAPQLLQQAQAIMGERAVTYDSPGGERSMAATVEAFNAITGRGLREAEGWLLMALLKMVRSESKVAPHRDSVEDLVSYAALFGEARLREGVKSVADPK